MRDVLAEYERMIAAGARVGRAVVTSVWGSAPRMAGATLLAGSNREGRCNREVVVPWVNGIDVLRRPRGRHIIDFGVDMSEQAAAEYVLPFAHVRARASFCRSVSRRPVWRTLR